MAPNRIWKCIFLGHDEESTRTSTRDLWRISCWRDAVRLFGTPESVRRRHREPQAEATFRSSCNYEAWENGTAQLAVALKPNSGTSGRKEKSPFQQRYSETSPKEEVLSKCLQFIVLAAPSSCWTDITYTHKWDEVNHVLNFGWLKRCWDYRVSFV
jgi:hypothetical protein